MENPKIALYKVREFGDIFNVTFAFIKQEFKPLGRVIMVFVLPFILIQGIVTAIFQTSYTSMLKNTDIFTNGLGTFWATFMSTYLLFIAVTIVVQTMIFSTIASYLKLYSKSENEITVGDVANEIKKYFFPILGAIIISFIITVIGFVLCIIPGIYLGVSLSVFLIALVMEDKGIGDAFSRSFQLVKTQWWGTFLLLFVSVILLYIVIMIFQIPAMIFGFTKVMHSITTHENPMEMFGPVYIIYTSIITAIQQLIYIVPIIIIAFQYFNLVEIREKSSLNQKINAIGQNE